MMKLQFKIQNYQTDAVNAIIDCFKGQPKMASINYRLDSETIKNPALFAMGHHNAPLNLDKNTLLENLHAVQHKNGLPLSEKLSQNNISPINLDIEMETGTGKTYCYIKTIFELNKQYGWSKFIVVVPSIAIREGAAKSFAITAEHFFEIYHKKARFFIYQSSKLDELNAFASDTNIHVMIINIQAFNARGQDARRIYEECDQFGSQKPIDVICANLPILILDEPQKMGGDKTLKSLENFKALMVLNYSATHRETHNKVYCLDAIEAYNKKLVKKIAVHGITIQNLSGTSAYLYLQSIELSSKDAPTAYIEFENKQKDGTVKRKVRRCSLGDNLWIYSNQLEAYRHGYTIFDINDNTKTVSFSNGIVLTCGQVSGDAHETTLRRIQIREAIRAHFDKEKQLFKAGIKVLSLFFIDEVAKYRDYSVPDEKGEYANIFEAEYQDIVRHVLAESTVPYREYLEKIAVNKTHAGYFSVDKKTGRTVDPTIKKQTLETDDVNAYDLILKDKERLLSLDEPVRFIFSHSALREGWDNPNVFVICTLKNSHNVISRRQEIGRGLRLAVNQMGERIDEPNTVHQTNILTVVTAESYTHFVSALQKEICADWPRDQVIQANKHYFLGQTLDTASGKIRITEEMATAIYHYLIKNDYLDEKDQLASTYDEARSTQSCAALPEILAPYTDAVLRVIDTASINYRLGITRYRELKEVGVNHNFYKKAFQDLWKKINHKASYSVAFNSEELIRKSVEALNQTLHIPPTQYQIERGKQVNRITEEKLREAHLFSCEETSTESFPTPMVSDVTYDLIGQLSQQTCLKRQTVCSILTQMDRAIFQQFHTNPEAFIAQAAKIIREQKATIMIEHIAYDTINERFSKDIFTINQIPDDAVRLKKLTHHICDYLIKDSDNEAIFAQNLDVSSEVEVYAKLPKGFYIHTPIGKYTPDWAISFKKDKVKHTYFVAETKGSSESMQLRSTESLKIDCAKHFFEMLELKTDQEKVTYKVVKNYEQLMGLVK